jgi:Na+/proline symporter
MNSPISGCCSPSPTTATSAPTAGRRSSPTLHLRLSLAVYATAWTFYGSVGRAATGGIGFLPIYLGPTLMIALWWLVLRKIIRISKANRITSLADFIASRYGKSALLGGLVTIIAVIGIMPYISLQLKAMSNQLPILWSIRRSACRPRRRRRRCCRTPRCTWR